MPNIQQEVNLQIEDNLQNDNKELEFQYDDSSFSFNVKNEKNAGEDYRYIHYYDKEDEKVPFDNTSSKEPISTEATVAYLKDGDHVFLSDNPLDIPLLHSFGINDLHGRSLKM